MSAAAKWILFSRRCSSSTAASSAVIGTCAEFELRAKVANKAAGEMNSLFIGCLSVMRLPWEAPLDQYRGGAPLGGWIIRDERAAEAMFVVHSVIHYQDGGIIDDVREGEVGNRMDLAKPQHGSGPRGERLIAVQ